MTDKVLKIIFYIVVSIIFLYFFVSFFESSLFKEKFVSEIVEESTVDNYIVVEGIALRSEKLLLADKEFKEIRYFVEDGDRIANHSAYASYYDTEISLYDVKKLEYLNRNISRLEESIEKGTQYSQLTINNSIKESLVNYLNFSDSINFRQLVSASYDIQSVFDQKLEQQLGTEYIQSIINELKAERREIYSSNNAQETTLYSSMAGFFVSFTDGYEYLNMDDYSAPTYQEYEELMASQPEYISSLCVGKLNHYSNWCFIASIPTEYVNNLYIGKKVLFDFTVDYSETVRASTVVSSISRAHEGNSIVRFNCSTLTSDFFSLRKENPKMIINTLSGIKISNDSLRVVDGETGVFVLSAQRVIFKPVEIIYSTDTFSLVKVVGNGNDGALKVKDEVIVGGKDLYDGKIVNIIQ